MRNAKGGTSKAMDYTIWVIGTALIGVCCLLIGYLWGAREPEPKQTGLDIMADLGKLLDEMERKGQIW